MSFEFPGYGLHLGNASMRRYIGRLYYNEAQVN